MNRADLQKLSDIRVEDATVLFDSRRLDGAYYMLGYAVECALKACVAKLIREHDFPDKKLINESYVHDLERLLVVSGVKHEHKEEQRTNEAFATNWAVVKDWSEQLRYEYAVPEKVVDDFFKAVTDPENGVLAWLKTRW